MRNQQDGGPPLRLTQVISRVFVYVIFIGILWFHEFFFQRTAAALINNNNTAEANNNNSNGGPREVARAAGFNFAGFRFRFGVVLTTHQTHRHLRQHQHNNQQDRQVISRVFLKSKNFIGMYFDFTNFFYLQQQQPQNDDGRNDTPQEPPISTVRISYTFYFLTYQQIILC